MSFKLWMESQSYEENRTKNLLLDYPNKEQIIDEFKNITTNQTWWPIFAIFYKEEPNIETLSKYIKIYFELEQKQHLPRLKEKAGNVIYNNQPISFQQFKNIVTSKKTQIEEKSKRESQRLVFSNEQFDIYKAQDERDCIELGKNYSFCISRVKENKYRTYRTGFLSTFYFIRDKIRKKDDLLHLVVVDVQKRRIEVTNANNEVMDSEGYLNYLKNHGVDISIFKRKLIQKDEIDDQTLSKEIPTLEEFKLLDKNQIEKYLLQYKNRLTPEQLDYIYQKGYFDIIKKYIINNKVKIDSLKEFKLLDEKEIKIYISLRHHKNELTTEQFNYVYQKGYFDVIKTYVLSHDLNDEQFEMLYNNRNYDLIKEYSKHSDLTENQYLLIKDTELGKHYMNEKKNSKYMESFNKEEYKELTNKDKEKHINAVIENEDMEFLNSIIEKIGLKSFIDKSLKVKDREYETALAAIKLILSNNIKLTNEIINYLIEHYNFKLIDSTLDFLKETGNYKEISMETKENVVKNHSMLDRLLHKEYEVGTIENAKAIMKFFIKIHSEKNLFYWFNALFFEEHFKKINDQEFIRELMEIGSKYLNIIILQYLTNSKPDGWEKDIKTLLNNLKLEKSESLEIVNVFNIVKHSKIKFQTSDALLTYINELLEYSFINSNYKNVYTIMENYYQIPWYKLSRDIKVDFLNIIIKYLTNEEFVEKLPSSDKELFRQLINELYKIFEVRELMGEEGIEFMDLIKNFMK